MKLREGGIVLENPDDAAKFFLMYHFVAQSLGIEPGEVSEHISRYLSGDMPAADPHLDGLGGDPRFTATPGAGLGLGEFGGGHLGHHQRHAPGGMRTAEPPGQSTLSLEPRGRLSLNPGPMTPPAHGLSSGPRGSNLARGPDVPHKPKSPDALSTLDFIAVGAVIAGIATCLLTVGYLILGDAATKKSSGQETSKLHPSAWSL